MMRSGEHSYLLPTNGQLSERREYKMPKNDDSYFWACLGTSVGLLAVSGGVGFNLLGRAFSQDCTTPCQMTLGYQGCFGIAPFVGLCFLVFLAPLGVFLFASAIVELSQLQPVWGKFLVQFMLLILSTICCCIITITWIYLLKPKTLYDYHGDALENDALLVLIGGFIFLAFGGLLLVSLAVSFQLLFIRLRSSPFVTFSAPYFQTSLNRLSFRENYLGVLGILVLMLVLAVVCSSFSSVWNYSAHSYFLASSPYSLLQENGVVNDWFSFKVYKDVLVYYGYIFGIVLLGFLAHISSPLRKFFHTRFQLLRVFNIRSKYHPCPTGISVGEAILLISTLGLSCYWMYYWRFEYSRIYAEKDPYPMYGACCANVSAGTDDDFVTDDDGTIVCHTPPDPHGLMQVWARVMGHMSTFFLSFTLYPVAKNSLWESAFGMPFERAIKYHRFFGVLGWVMVTSHMVIWMLKWAFEDTLWNNVFRLDNLRITPYMYHWDNFTIVLAEMGWLGLTVSLAVAILFRSRNYTLFHYVHMFTIVFFVIAIMHAWTFWYYAIGGLFLWFLDRCIRLVRRAKAVSLLAVTYCKEAGVTRLKLPNSELQHEAGQFAYVCVPGVSRFEWHPFSISSHPGAAYRTFHIKDMGSGTFTEQIGRFARRNPQPNVDMVVRVDGPYGRASYYSSHNTLVLVAGGIGITPLYSVLAEVYSRYVARRPIGSIKKVKLVWIARTRAMLIMFAEFFQVIMQAAPFFEVSLYCTGPIEPACHCFQETNLGRDAAEFVSSKIVPGRPNLSAIFAGLPSGRGTMALVCGPRHMVVDVSELSFRHNFSFHEETFEF